VNIDAVYVLWWKCPPSALWESDRGSEKKERGGGGACFWRSSLRSNQEKNDTGTATLM